MRRNFLRRASVQSDVYARLTLVVFISVTGDASICRLSSVTQPELQAAYEAHNNGRSSEAGKLIEKAWERVRIAGLQAPEFAADVQQIAQFHLNLGHDLEAEGLYQKALDASQRLGEKSEVYQNVLSGLGQLYLQEQRELRAQAVFERLAALQTASGMQEWPLRSTLTNLANLYERAAKFADAETTFRRLAEMHDSAALEFFYQRRGRAADAERLLRQTLADAEQAPGPNNSELVSRLMEWISFLRGERRYPEAEDQQKRLIELNGTPSGFSYQVQQLSEMYIEAGDFAQANQVTEQELSRIAGINGVQDAAYRQGLLNYAAIQSGAKNYAAAEKILDQYLALAEQSGEAADSEVEMGLWRLANVYGAGSDQQKAQQTREKALARQRIREGPNAEREVERAAQEAIEALNNLNFDLAHDRVAHALAFVESSSGQTACYQAFTLTRFFAPLHGLQRTEEAHRLAERLASVADRNSCTEMMQPIYSGIRILIEFDRVAGRWSDAEGLLRQELERLTAAKGADSPGLSSTLEELSGAVLAGGNFARAEELKLQRLSIEETAHGPDHPVLIPVITSLASFYDAAQQWDRAEPLWQRALTLSDKSHNPNDQDRAWPHSQFADSLVSRNELERAREQYNEALEILQQHAECAASAEDIRAKIKVVEERLRAAIAPSPEPLRRTALR